MLFEEEKGDHGDNDKAVAKVPPFFRQAETVKEFLKIAFERDNLPLLRFEENQKVKIDSYGAKFLLAGTDRTVNNFLQEYVP